MAEPGLKKRSVVVAGHATSVALEPRFWGVLDDMAAGANMSLPALVARIDQSRGGGSLASALRLAALDHALSKELGPTADRSNAELQAKLKTDEGKL